MLLAVIKPTQADSSDSELDTFIPNVVKYGEFASVCLYRESSLINSELWLLCNSSDHFQVILDQHRSYFLRKNQDNLWIVVELLTPLIVCCLLRFPQQDESSVLNITSVWHHQALPYPLSPSTIIIILITFISSSALSTNTICGPASCYLSASGLVGKWSRWALLTSTSTPTP